MGEFTVLSECPEKVHNVATEEVIFVEFLSFHHSSSIKTRCYKWKIELTNFSVLVDDSKNSGIHRIGSVSLIVKAELRRERRPPGEATRTHSVVRHFNHHIKEQHTPHLFETTMDVSGLP